MGKLLKKIFSSFIALMTIAWSVGIGSLALPAVARAATPGDLIKASGPEVYYYAADNKRYVFPNEKTYFSWFSDFSSVMTISDAELASILIGGNVTVRPGTMMVKIQTDPKTYAVGHDGLLHWVESEAVASALYGANWNQRIWDVPDSFFPNYTVGASLSTPVHADGTLIQYSSSPDIYVMADGMKRHFTSEAAFAANGYKMSDVITTSVSYPDGADVTGREGRLADVIYVPGGPVASGNLNVTLASDTPAGMTVPKNANSVQLAKWNFTAGSADVTVSGLTVTRVGIGSTTDLQNVYLYDGSGNRLTTGRTINSSTNKVQFNALNRTVAAGATVSYVLWGDFSSPSATGGEHAFEISDAASVVVGSGTIAGTFPLRGNTFLVGTASAARVDVQSGVDPTDPDIGSANAEISNFKLIANTNDVEIRRITLLQAGSVSNTDLTDLNLYQGSTVVATVAALVGDKIVLNFTNPFLLTEGTTRTFSLHARVGGRSGRTIKTYVEYATDIYAVDTTFNSGADVCIASSGDCTTGSFDGTSTNYIEVTTQGGQLTTAFNGPATSNIAKGSQDVHLFEFSLTSQASNLEIRKLYFNIQGETSATDLVKGSAGTEYFRDIKVVNLDTGATFMGPISMSATLASSSTATGVMTFTDSQIIPPDTTVNLALTADLSNSEDTTNEFFGDNNNRYRVEMNNGSAALFGSSDVRITDTGEFLATTEIVPNSTIDGNYHTVKASSLTVSLASSPSAGTAVKKQAMIPSVGLVFTAGSESDVKINTVKLTGRGDVTTPLTYALADLNDVVTQCALFDGATQVGTSESPDATTGAMNITNVNATVAAGTTRTLTVKCTADSVVAGTEDRYAVGVALADDITAQDSDSNSVTPTLSSDVSGNSGASPILVQTVKNSGTLTIATDNLPQSTILVAGDGTWQNLAQFKATAQYEPMTIQKIMVTSSYDAANFTEIGVWADTSIVGQSTLPHGTYQNRDIDLTANPISIPKDGSVVFKIVGLLAPTQSSSETSGATSGVARSGNLLAAGIGAGNTADAWGSSYSGKFNVRTVGEASGDLVYATGSDTVGNTFVLRKTKPTVTRQSLSTVILANGSNQDLYKVRISADIADSVALKKMTFDVSKTGSSTLTNFRVRKGSTDMSLSNFVITDEAGNDLEAGTMGAAISTGKVVVTFTNEESISGSGTTYTLYATPAASVTGDTVSVSFSRDLTQTVTTGYLASDAISSLTGPNIDTSTAPDDASDLVGYFVWSDNSEFPHSSTVGTASSRDWTNDVYIEDLTQTQTLVH